MNILNLENFQDHEIICVKLPSWTHVIIHQPRLIVCKRYVDGASLKNPPANARNTGSIPRLQRSPRERDGSPF